MLISNLKVFFSDMEQSRQSLHTLWKFHSLLNLNGFFLYRKEVKLSRLINRKSSHDFCLLGVSEIDASQYMRNENNWEHVYVAGRSSIMEYCMRSNPEECCGSVISLVNLVLNKRSLWNERKIHKRKTRLRSIG